MSATNSTPNLGLPQYVDEDIPTILEDFNGAMQKIDDAVGGGGGGYDPLSGKNLNMYVLLDGVKNYEEDWKETEADICVPSYIWVSSSYPISAGDVFVVTSSYQFPEWVGKKAKYLGGDSSDLANWEIDPFLWPTHDEEYIMWEGPTFHCEATGCYCSLSFKESKGRGMVLDGNGLWAKIENKNPLTIGLYEDREKIAEDTAKPYDYFFDADMSSVSHFTVTPSLEWVNVAASLSNEEIYFLTHLFMDRDAAEAGPGTREEPLKRFSDVYAFADTYAQFIMRVGGKVYVENVGARTRPVLDSNDSAKSYGGRSFPTYGQYRPLDTMPRIVITDTFRDETQQATQPISFEVSANIGWPNVDFENISTDGGDNNALWLVMSSGLSVEFNQPCAGTYYICGKSGSSKLWLSDPLGTMRIYGATSNRFRDNRESYSGGFSQIETRGNNYYQEIWVDDTCATNSSINLLGPLYLQVGTSGLTNKTYSLYDSGRNTFFGGGVVSSMPVIIEKDQSARQPITINLYMQADTSGHSNPNRRNSYLNPIRYYCGIYTFHGSTKSGSITFNVIDRSYDKKGEYYLAVLGDPNRATITVNGNASGTMYVMVEPGSSNVIAPSGNTKVVPYVTAS